MIINKSTSTAECDSPTNQLSDGRAGPDTCAGPSPVARGTIPVAQQEFIQMLIPPQRRFAGCVNNDTTNAELHRE